MKKGTTKSGFEFEIDESLADDIEFAEKLAVVDENPLKFPALLEEAIGKKQKTALYEHLRDDNGKVSTTKVINEFVEMMNSTGEETKNF